LIKQHDVNYERYYVFTAFQLLRFALGEYGKAGITFHFCVTKLSTAL